MPPPSQENAKTGNVQARLVTESFPQKLSESQKLSSQIEQQCDCGGPSQRAPELAEEIFAPRHKYNYTAAAC